MTRKKVIRLVGVIFLALLLILTFFSRTIMNRSLPVVTVQKARSGEITHPTSPARALWNPQEKCG